MNWAGAIDINHKALARILASLLVMAGLASEAAVAARLPYVLYRRALRLLHPMESAVRRLIVIAARGLEVKLPPFRPMPEDQVIIRKKQKGTGRNLFQLFDTRKRSAWVPYDTPDSEARHRRRPVGQSRPVGRPLPDADGMVDATQLSRRILALKQALDNLPAQAQRMARWKARRQRMVNPKFTSPLRPGSAPGSRQRPRPIKEIDLVLEECHGLARDALREDTS